jgi:hypothetical protein
MADEVAARVSHTGWGLAALNEMVSRIVRIALLGATGISECACLTFSLPDRELARTDNLGGLIREIKGNAEELR